MRTTITAFAFAAALAFASAPAAAAPKLETFEIHGETVHASATIPPEVIGTYLYEKKGEPTIELRADNTGAFQPHMVAPIPVRYWIRTDDKGVPMKRMGEGNPNYGYLIVVQYGPGGDGNYPENGYDMWMWVNHVEGGCQIIFGERFKCG